MEALKQFLTPQRKAELQAFVQLLAKHPEALRLPELAFFAEYLVGLGAKLPEPKPQPQPEPAPAPAPKAEDDDMPDLEPTGGPAPAPAPQPATSPEPEPEKEPEEAPDPDLIAPDSEDEHTRLEMGDKAREVSEADMDAANEIKARAMAVTGDDAEGVRLLTEAIVKNPRSAILFASRAALLLRMKRPNAAVRDCDAAIALNPDSAKPYKVRGKALRFLGKYEQARRDLQTGNRLDFDEGTFEVQRWVEQRLKAHDEFVARTAARRREREEMHRQRERAEAEQRRKQRAAQPQQQEEEDAEGGSDGMPGGMDFLNDPEVMAAMQDPAMRAKLMEVLQSGNPAKFMEAQSDPKLAKILAKIMKSAQGMRDAGAGAGAAGVPPGAFSM